MNAQQFETLVESASHFIREAKRHVFIHSKGVRQDAKLREIKLRLARERREIERVLS